MSSVPVTQRSRSEADTKLADEFKRVADRWRAETAYVSSASDLVAHPAFAEMVAMGPPVIPFILRELEKRTGHWHRVLRRITGVDPVPPESQGNMDRAAEAWLRWGKEQGFEW